MARRHLDHFAALARALAEKIHGPDQLLVFEHLDQELDNLRLAISLASRAQPELALELAINLAWYWNVRGQYQEGIELLQDLLAVLPTAIGLRAAGLAALGRLALNVADAPLSEASLTQAIEAWRPGGNGVGLAHALVSKAMLSINLGRPRPATEALLLEALAAARRAGDAHETAQALLWLGVSARNHGEHATGVHHGLQALELARSSGDEWVLAMALLILGGGELMVGQLAQARAHLEESLERWQALNDPHNLARTINRLGQVALAEGHLDEAESYVARALSMPTAFPEALAVEAMAGVAGARARYRLAARLLGAASAMPSAVPSQVRPLEEQAWFAGAVKVLGEEALRADWDRGRRTRPAEAVRYALARDYR